LVEAILLRARRGDSPLFRFLRRLARAFRTSALPLPRFLTPLLGLGYHLHRTLAIAFRWLARYFYIEPLFRGRCASLGKRLIIYRLPFVVGHTRIQLGDDVHIFGKFDIFSARVFDHPALIVGNRVDIGHNVVFVVNREITIEDDVNLASGVRLMDSDAHPKDARDRAADLPPSASEIKPVRIGRGAWIGQNSFVLKGVTVGAGAIIGVNSVVFTDIPPYSVAIGNPARVVSKLPEPAPE
jgi:acetyltransferase-like isoleucine patch superfamily enzyme